MAAEPDQDRNAAATPHKLAEAHKKGQVARSAELGSAVVFLAAVAYLHADGLGLLRRIFTLAGQILRQAGGAEAVNEAGLWHLVDSAVRDALGLLAPLGMVLVVAGLLANLAQTRGMFSLSSVMPDGSRLQLLAGLKRIVSARALFDVCRTLAKLGVLAAVLYGAAAALIPHIQQSGRLTPSSFLLRVLDDIAAMAGRIGVAMLLIAFIDLAFVHREFGRKMRMSRREVREESRQREGDPRIRSRVRELRREMLKRSLAVRRTRHADLVVTNPTHYAVALRYRHGQMAAPQVLAKGAGVMAWAMRQVAHRHQVPVVARPALARALYAQVAVDESLPEVFYRDVAQLLIWVMSMKQRSQPAAGAMA